MNFLKTKLSLSIKIPTVQEANNMLIIEKQSKDNIMQKSECNLVYENIYLSGYNSANDLEFLSKNKFTHIVNCAKSSKSFTQETFENIEYLNLTIEDDPGFPIMESIKIFIDFIEKLNKSNPNRKILVHCFEGISRAPSLLAAYLIWKLKINKESALKMIKDKRPCVEINLGFLYQLEKWNQFCNQQKENNRENNKYLNRKIEFRIKKNFNLFNEKRCTNDEDYIDDGNYSEDEEDIFFHSKIRVIEENKGIDNFISLIRVLNTKSKNENEDLDRSSCEENNDIH